MKPTPKQSQAHKKPTPPCQFIVKLQQMMKSYPENVKWSEDGEHVCFVDLNKIQNQVIPCFFRHRNMLSFVRQLNMYYFSKLEADDPDCMKFKHSLFKKGNDDYFHLISRRNKTRDQIIGNLQKNYSQTLQLLQNEHRLTQQTKSIIRVAIEYHSISLKSLKKIKGAIEELNQQMKSVRSKDIKSSLLKLREQSMDSLCQLIQEYKALDGFIKDMLCRDLNVTNSSEMLPYSYPSQIILFDQPRTIKEVQLNKGMALQSEYSLLNFKSECSLEKNFKQQDDLENNQQISLQQDLKQENYRQL